jgi:SPP1 gp7 family putative phage head morphogenesis protein
MTIPKEVLSYLKNKIRVGADSSPFPAFKNFSYKDIWHEEHAANFTVAKALQMDVLKDINEAVIQAAEKGESLEHFIKNLKPVLRQKGWWGKKNMIDPLTNEEVKAQLGGDCHLKVIYNTNVRSAYQQGKWERTQASDAHPYLMYRVGNSKKHRKEHLAWDGLILPKDDPWWNSHFPQNDYGCKCWTQAVSEARAEKLKQNGFNVPPSVEGRDGYHVDVKTQAPQERYVSYFNERKGTIEKVPAGVHPSFNWNVGRAGRDIPLWDSFMKKGKDGAFHPDIEAVAKTILTNRVARQEFDAFIDKAYSGVIQGSRATAAGFIENKIAAYLKKNAGIDIGDSVTISLEARLLNGLKGNAVDKYTASNIIDSLLYGNVYYDKTGTGTRTHAGNLVYIFPYSDDRFFKITVNPKSVIGSDSIITGPSIRSIDTIKKEGLVWIQNNMTKIK